MGAINGGRDRTQVPGAGRGLAPLCDHPHRYPASISIVRRALFHRVRLKDGSSATLTIKSRRAERRRVEVEYPIAVADAEALLSLRESSLISKIRHAVPWGNHVWEVDVFRGDNEGLVIAEIELHDDHESFDRPPWLGVEVTGHQQYYNSSLARRPYCRWSGHRRLPATAA